MKITKNIMNKYTQTYMDSQKNYTRHFKKIVANTSQIILIKKYIF